ncbi:hypothetical protein [Aminipila sp.]|uniref:hypothetical protein n=1 Tax=Aminipila sp. TaxID=2060095 RepID=UPI0028982B87|nr:hypothetical protein [Aminipila sp.]
MSQCLEPKMRIAKIRSNLEGKKNNIPKAQPVIPLSSMDKREILNYGEIPDEMQNDLQYVNEFFSTQIGNYVQVDCYVGLDEMISKCGYLVRVGIDYIVLQDATTKNITSVDFWSIKFMQVYYDAEELKKC